MRYDITPMLLDASLAPCPCGCEYGVHPGRKFASAACYGRFRYSEAFKQRNPNALHGAAAEDAWRAFIAAAKPICPGCQSGKARLLRRYNGNHEYIADPARRPVLRHGCRSCSASYELLPDDTTRFMASGVYFLKCEDFIKIGVSVDFRFRSRHYLTDNPFDISLVGFVPRGLGYSEDLEAKLHAHFASLRHRGEWFRAEPALVSWIEQKATKFLPEIVEIIDAHR